MLTYRCSVLPPSVMSNRTVALTLFSSGWRPLRPRSSRNSRVEAVIVGASLGPRAGQGHPHPLASEPSGYAIPVVGTAFARTTALGITLRRSFLSRRPDASAAGTPVLTRGMLEAPVKDGEPLVGQRCCAACR